MNRQAGPPRIRTAAPDRREFDGIICFAAEDWWYHNRGHYDMRMMVHLSSECPVLLVNAIGLRIPAISEGAMFFRRIARKARSLRRGLVVEQPAFGVLSPVAAPGRFGAILTRLALPWQVRRAAATIGITKPLVWVAMPTVQPILDALRPVGVIYQRTDHFEAFPGVDKARIVRYDRALKARADLTIYVSTLLFNEESESCRSAAFIDHGVDFDRFAGAGERMASAPADLAHLKHPLAGYVGAIDDHTFDPELFLAVARRMEDVSFVLVGPCALPAGWCKLPNVELLGQQPYERVADYMAACDVLLMPWNRTPWVEACNPVKLKEYLAVGRPVVSTPFPELERYDGLVRRAVGAEQFAAQIRAALTTDGDPERQRERVQSETWAARACEVLRQLSDRGIDQGKSRGT